MDFDFYTKEEINAMLNGLTFIKISQADFDAIITKDTNTIYYVYDENGNITQYLGGAALSSGSAGGVAALSVVGEIGIAGVAERIEE